MIFDTIRRWFNSLIRSLWGLLKTIFTGATELILAQLKDIAIEAVEELSKTDMTNEEKRTEAFKRISTYAMTKGINAKESLINLVIEIAVQYIKTKIQ